MVLIISILDTVIPDRRMSPLRSPLRKGSDTDCESTNEANTVRNDICQSLLKIASSLEHMHFEQGSGKPPPFSMKAIDSDKSIILAFLRLQLHKHVIQCHENSLSTLKGVDDQNLFAPLAVRSTNIYTYVSHNCFRLHVQDVYS